MDLGAETNLQSQSHNRGQTTLGLDYASLSSKQMACGFSYWDKMSILQITFWKIEVFKVTVEPTVLHCLDCTLYRYCHYYMLLLMLTPLGFHSNILLRFNCEKKRVNLWSSSLYGRFHFHNCEKYYPNTVNNSPCGGFQSDWNVLPEHVEFASLGFIKSLWIVIES